jgi:hypothetical protein
MNKQLTRLFFIGLIICCITNSGTCYADTIDVWTVKRNGKDIIHSNQMQIVHGNQPMEVNLATFSDRDTLKIFYWTDSGGEELLWNYIFKDSNDVFIDKFTNAIDSTARCFPSPCKTFWRRKGFIPFLTADLKQLMKEKNVDKILVEFEPESPTGNNPYRNKKVCIISNH